MKVIGVAGISQIQGLELNLYVATLAKLDEVRTWQLACLRKGIAAEQVVRRAIFLDDDDHMLNLRNVVVLGVGQCCRKRNQKQ